MESSKGNLQMGKTPQAKKEREKRNEPGKN